MRVKFQNAAASIACSACLVAVAASPGVTALEVTGAQEVAAHAARISHAQYDLMAATSNPITYLTQLANDTTAAVFNVGALPFNVKPAALKPVLPARM